MIRVLITDDHPMVRKGLVQLVAESGDMQVVDEADGYPGVVRVLREHEVDVMLLDVEMPGKNGLEVLKSVRRSHPRVQILMFSMYPEAQYAVRALKAGAAGYLTKRTAPQVVLEAIRNAARGRKYVTPELALALADSIAERGDQARPPHELLSDREFQTLRMIASGSKLGEIAQTLSLSPKTVSVYRTRLLDKMRMKTNAELTRYAVQNDLLD